MKSMPLRLFAATLSCLVLMQAPRAQESDELDPTWRAKLAKERTKQRIFDTEREAADTSSEPSSGNECGRVDIGNYRSNGKPGNTRKEINVFITGDVINAARCRR